MIDKIFQVLQDVGLKLEIISYCPISIRGADEIKVTSGIRILKNAFFIKLVGNKWLVELPEGSRIAEYQLDNSEQATELVINYFQQLWAYNKKFEEEHPD